MTIISIDDLGVPAMLRLLQLVGKQPFQKAELRLMVEF